MVRVKVAEGLLEGEKVSNPYGGEYYSFKGIPYADPPVGDLRFKAPVPKQPWQGVRDAKTCGPSSLQIDHMSLDPKVIGSEDCLYLNVYSPELNPAKPLPVMVYFHPGGYFTGNGDDDFCGPQFLVKEDVILVTLNFRLGVLGFLCLDTEDIPGNAGMKDKVAALKWVNKNISNFGGDPDNVTIIGMSAGSMSVTVLMVSPMAQGLFKRGIAQSGTALTLGVGDPLARERGLALAKRLGCESDNDKEIYEFFKTVPAEKFIGCQVPLTFLEANKISTNSFLIVVEKKFNNVVPFLTKEVCKALAEKVHAPNILLGYAEHEGGCYILNDPEVENAPEKFNNYRELLVPYHLLPMSTIDKQFEIAKHVKEFYFKKDAVSMKNLDKVLDFYTFDVFGFPVAVWAKLCAQKKNSNVYLYKFTCKTERNMIKILSKPESWNILGDREITNHGDDMFYIFPIVKLLGDRKIGDKAYKCIDNVVKLWTNYAKYGNPTPDNSLGVKWKPYTTNEKNYLEIGNRLTTGVNVDEETVQFWENLHRKYGGSDLKARFGL